MTNSVTVEASPSIALIKYWGKLDSENNLPATTSIALTLSKTKTRTTVTPANDGLDRVVINNELQASNRFAPFFNNLRNLTNSNLFFDVNSINNFPTAAGIASSASGFAALAKACLTLIQDEPNNELVSSIARLGSASASRSVFGGFTILKRGEEYAQPLHDLDFWPNLRVLIVKVSEEAKPISSRAAMELSRTSSPYYPAWVEDAEKISTQSISALALKNLKILGPLIQSSYLRMFATMTSSMPPTLYWLPDSLRVIKMCSNLRNEGLEIWETMDAGPQVKIFCELENLKTLLHQLEWELPHLQYIVDEPGSGASLVI